MRRAPRSHSVLTGLAGLTVAMLSALIWWVDSGATVLSVTRTSTSGHEWSPDKPLFVALIGDDKRPGEGCGCADAVHVVGIPAGGGSAVLLNIPRDTRVDVPGFGKTRINAAYVKGKSKLTAQVLGDLVGVDITYVVHVNYVKFPKLVDELGGLDVEVPFRINDSGSGANFNKGVHHMNGTQALAFARSRHIPGGDFGRTENHGRLILAALGKLQSMGSGPLDTVKYLGIMMRHTDTTNIGPVELYRLARTAQALAPSSIRNIVMPGVSTTVGGFAYVAPTAAAAPLFADFADDAILQSS
jgi:polyisoprenyl-teichoic acid--peptidoglycan teichoic acid transferase